MTTKQLRAALLSIQAQGQRPDLSPTEAQALLKKTRDLKREILRRIVARL